MKRKTLLIRLAYSIPLVLLAINLTEAQRLTVQIPTFPAHEVVEKLLSEGEVAGMAISIVNKGIVGQTEVFGMKNSAASDPMDAATVFEAASLSKPVVAFGVLLLVDKDLLNLDDPVYKFLDNAELRGNSRWKLLTIRMLLDHTSGLPNELRHTEKIRFHFNPGEHFSYSGYGFSLLQQVMETITGQPFEQYMKTAVFEPAGMRSSRFVWHEEYEARKANGHDSIGRPTAIRKPMSPRAPSSLHTTAGDYALFLAAVLNRSGLTPALWKEMVTPHARVQQNCVVCINQLAGTTSSAIAWGLGWGIEQSGDRTFLFHWGDNNGDFQAFVMGDVDSRKGIIILTNSGNGLSVIPEIVHRVIPAKHEAFSWMGYERYDSPFKVILRRIATGGFNEGLRFSEAQQLTESQWNIIGYNLLARNKIVDAIKAFEHNIQLHPDSANAYDSLGEGYAAAGQTAEAIKNYMRSLALDPTNDNAKQMIQKLKDANPGQTSIERQ